MHKSFSFVLAAVLLSTATANNGNGARPSIVTSMPAVIPPGAPGCGSLITSVSTGSVQTTIDGTLTTYVPFTTTNTECANTPTGPLVTYTIYPGSEPTAGTTTTRDIEPANCTTTVIPMTKQTTIGTVTTTVHFNSTSTINCATATGDVTTYLPTTTPTVTPSAGATTGSVNLAGALSGENGAGVVGASWVVGLVAAAVGAFTLV
ncbi:hypothetical protein DFP72DRAFT_921289 [Ephemerocybe angulata]|uniref:Uncharacterized protein n=1 Tax=Ephemerocybe angulata TaxID=980116 RepID=A0A8H6HI70_9AGAR|nr:hypothetical protein DFP72DRAFT_921289 [Tulosesus angulatus]